MEAEPQLEPGSSEDGHYNDRERGGYYSPADSPRDQDDSLVASWQVHVRVGVAFHTLELPPDASVVEVKEQIARIEGTPAESQRLLLSVPGPRGVPLSAIELNDMFSLSECGVKDGGVIVLEAASAGAGAPRSAGGSPAGLSAQALRAFTDERADKPAEAVEQWLSHADGGPSPEPEPSPDAASVGGGRRDIWRLLQCANLLDALVDGQPLDAALASLGVEEVEDLSVLEPEDFESIGVAEAQQQIILSLAAGFEAGAGERTAEEEEEQHLQQQSPEQQPVEPNSGAAASARLAQLSTPNYRSPRGGSSSPSGSGRIRTPRSGERTVAVEKFVARQRAWNGMRQRNLEMKREEVMKQEGSLQPKRRLTRAEVDEFAERQMDAVELREIRREMLKEELDYNERGGSEWQLHDTYVDVDTFAARQDERRIEAKMRLAEKAAALDAENKASFAGVPVVNDSSTRLAEKFYAPLAGAADSPEGAEQRRAAVGAGNLTQAIGADVFQRLSSPMRPRGSSGGGGGTGKRRPPPPPAKEISAWSDMDAASEADQEARERSISVDQGEGAGVRSPVRGPRRSPRRTASGGQQRKGGSPRGGGARPRAMSAQRAAPLRSQSPALMRSLSAQRSHDPHLFRERLQQYGRYANRLNTGLETGGPSTRDAAARVAMLQQAEQERRMRRARAAADRRRVVETGRQRRRSGWGPPPSSRTFSPPDSSASP